MSTPLEDLFNDILNGSTPNIPGFAPSFTDVLKAKVLPALLAFGKFATDNPEDLKALRSSVLLIVSQIGAYSSARKLQPIINKIIAGERLSRKDSRALYGRIGNLVAATVATAYLSYQNAKQLHEYNNR